MQAQVRVAPRKVPAALYATVPSDSKKGLLHMEETKVDGAELMVGTYSNFGKEKGCHMRGYKRPEPKDGNDNGFRTYAAFLNKDTGTLQLFETITYAQDAFIGPSGEAVEAERTLRASAVALNTGPKIDRASYGRTKRALIEAFAPAKKKRQVTQLMAERVDDDHLADRANVIASVRVGEKSTAEQQERTVMNQLLPPFRTDTEDPEQAYDVKGAFPIEVRKPGEEQPLYKALRRKLAGKDDVDFSTKNEEWGKPSATVAYLVEKDARGAARMKKREETAARARDLIIVEGLIRMYGTRKTKIKSAKHLAKLLDDVVALDTAEHFLYLFAEMSMSGADTGTPREVYLMSPVLCQKLIFYLIVFLVDLSPTYTVEMDALASDLGFDLAKMRNFAQYCGVKSSKSGGSELGKLILPLKVKAKITASPNKKR